jgi:hypothetical protein
MSEKEITSIKELFDEKIKGIHIQLDTEFKMINERLEKIEAQTTKTNGRVTTIEQNNIRHIIECPVVSRVNKLEERANRFYFFEKYPAFTVVTIVVFGMVLIMSFLASVNII